MILTLGAVCLHCVIGGYSADATPQARDAGQVASAFPNLRQARAGDAGQASRCLH
jgi:hypothetical protein